MSTAVFPNWCCQKCGEPIGYLGRFVELIFRGHEHKKPAVYFMARQEVINIAFDLALDDAAATRNVAIDTDLKKGLLAVQINDVACGPTANLVVAILHARGYEEFKLHSLRGHYVVLDTITGAFFDIETYTGRSEKTLLAIWDRSRLYDGGGQNDFSCIQNEFALKWIEQRNQATKQPT